MSAVVLDLLLSVVRGEKPQLPTGKLIDG